MPDAEMLIKIAEVFGVTASELLGEDKDLNGNKTTIKFDKSSKSIMKTVAKVAFCIFMCYFIFLIVQAVFGIGVSVNTDISDNTVQIG